MMFDRCCEALENRTLLAAVLDSNGVLHVTATAGADTVGLGLNSNAPTKLQVVINNAVSNFTLASVKSISIDLGDGNDLLAVGAGVGPVYCLGGLGDDTLLGGDAADTLTAGGGRDSVNGGAGDDRLDGGPSPDRVDGGDGADRIYGSDANDILTGGAGVDRLFGGAGNDLLSGGSS